MSATRESLYQSALTLPEAEWLEPIDRLFDRIGTATGRLETGQRLTVSLSFREKTEHRLPPNLTDSR